VTKPLIAILGCGPSGLLAAHACEMYGAPFSIFSRPEKSVLGGAQFSHIPIPGITDPEYPEKVLRYEVVGEASGYQHKVYGEADVPFVSFDNVFDGKEVPAWNLRGIYDSLWARFSPRIVPQDISAKWVERIAGSDFYHLIFSSVPATTICRAAIDMDVSHAFRSQSIVIHPEALDPSLPDNTIRYDGTKDHSYYRMSRIFGVGGTEWGGNSPVPPIQPMRSIRKPIQTNCNCHPKVQRIGRFGTWTKGVLTMHAFNKVVETLEVWSEDL